MTTTTASTAIVPFDPVFADPKRLALAGFLAGYSGMTRDAYELDLRQYVAWCDDHDLDCSRRAGLTSKNSPESWSAAAGLGRLWPAGCAR